MHVLPHLYFTRGEKSYFISFFLVYCTCHLRAATHAMPTLFTNTYIYFISFSIHYHPQSELCIFLIIYAHPQFQFVTYVHPHPLIPVLASIKFNIAVLLLVSGKCLENNYIFTCTITINPSCRVVHTVQQLLKLHLCYCEIQAWVFTVG